jgi:3-methyladenine DNA glycosylase AlkD
MSGQLNARLKEVTDRLVALAGYSPLHPARGREVHRLRTVSVPAQRRANRAGYSFITASRTDNLASWDYIWNESAYHEVMCQALYFYQQGRWRPLMEPEVATIRRWSDRCICWEHSDDLAKIYAHVVEANPELILPALKRWSGASNPWLRRMSMTSLIEYARKRRHFLPYEELMSFVLPLIDDDEFYVQKGLGWTVREIGNAYPEQFAAFMAEYAARLSPQAWTGATKNMGHAEKARLMAIRKAG